MQPSHRDGAKEEVATAPGKRRRARPRGGHWDFDRPTDAVVAILDRTGVPYLAVRDGLRAHRAATGQTGYYAIDPHFDASGHRVVAALLRDFIAALLAPQGAS